MPYGYKNFKKSGKRQSSKGSTTLARKALNAVKTLKKTISPELKSSGDVAAFLTPTTSTSFADLVNPPKGTADTGRVGNQIKLLSYDFRITLSAPAAMTEPNMWRIMIFNDRQPPIDGTTTSLTDLLDFVSCTGHRNLDWRKRFRVYYDRVHKLDPANGPKQLMIHSYKRLGLKVIYTDATRTGNNEVSTNCLQWAVIPYDGTATTHQADLAFNIRTRFTDC